MKASPFKKLKSTESFTWGIPSRQDVAARPPQGPTMSPPQTLQSAWSFPSIDPWCKMCSKFNNCKFIVKFLLYLFPCRFTSKQSISSWFVLFQIFHYFDFSFFWEWGATNMKKPYILIDLSSWYLCFLYASNEGCSPPPPCIN